MTALKLQLLHDVMFICASYTSLPLVRRVSLKWLFVEKRGRLLLSSMGLRNWPLLNTAMLQWRQFACHSARERRYHGSRTNSWMSNCKCIERVIFIS